MYAQAHLTRQSSGHVVGRNVGAKGRGLAQWRITHDMSDTASTNPSGPSRTAIILSGGGARGAYEVGVLWYIFDDFSRLYGRTPRVDILSGTSVGAINACYLASNLSDPVLGLRRLVNLWSELQLSKVLGFGLKQVVGLPKLLTGGGDGSGLFDLNPMASLIQKEISWRAISRVLAKRELRALTCSATEIQTGRTVVFMQTAPDCVMPTTAPPRTIFREAAIGPTHALASAAIPMIFPPVRLDSQLYVDGGLRQNTPISPALRLGATHVIAMGSSRDVRGVVLDEGMSAPARAPGAAFLVGKVLNAFLLDHMDADVELLSRLNGVLRDGKAAYGPDFETRINRVAREDGRLGYNEVNCLTVRPSEDLGQLAADHIKSGRFRGNAMVARRLLGLTDFGFGGEADLASYILFDGGFARQLIELGRSDAHARRRELLEFFAHADAHRGDDAPLSHTGAPPPVSEANPRIIT